MTFSLLSVCVCLSMCRSYVSMAFLCALPCIKYRGPVSSKLSTPQQTTNYILRWVLTSVLPPEMTFSFLFRVSVSKWLLGWGILCFVFQNNNNKYSDLRVVPSVCVLTTSSTGASVSSTFVPIFVAFFLLFLTLPTKLWLVECFSSWVEQQSTGLTESLKKSGMWAMIQ